MSLSSLTLGTMTTRVCVSFFTFKAFPAHVARRRASTRGQSWHTRRLVSERFDEPSELAVHRSDGACYIGYLHFLQNFILQKT